MMHMKTLLNAALLLTLLSGTAQAEINAAEAKPKPSLPFTMSQWGRSHYPGGVPSYPMG
jgi:hypothetical protein